MTASTAVAPRLTTGGRLPELSLPAAPGGAPVNLRRQGRQATVLICIHDLFCEICRGYLQELNAHREALRDWDGRALVILHDGLEAAEALRSELGLDFPVLADEDGRLEREWGLAWGAFLIADQWGEIFHVEAGGEGLHPFPAPAEVAEWLRFVTIQCPECQGEAL